LAFGPVHACAFFLCLKAAEEATPMYRIETTVLVGLYVLLVPLIIALALH